MTTTTIAESATAVEHGRVRRRHRVLTRDGVSLAVTDWSAPTVARTVVFLHGLCLSQAAWDAQADYVLCRFPADTRVIAYDHRGHGRSGTADTETYTVEQLADDLDDVLDTLRVRGPLTLVGHSMGGMTAMAYAAAPRGRVVDGLVLVATASGGLCGQGVGRAMNRLAAEPLCEALTRIPASATGTVTAPVRFLLDRVRSVAGPRAAALAGVFSDALATASLHTAVGFLRDLRHFDQTANLHRISAYTTIVSGGDDLLTPPVLAWEIEAAIRGSRHIHLPEAGHMLPQEHPRVVNAAIAAAVEAAGTAAARAAVPLRARQRRQAWWAA